MTNDSGNTSEVEASGDTLEAEKDTDDEDGLKLPQTYSQFTEKNIEAEESLIPRTYTQGSIVNIESSFKRDHLGSELELPYEDGSQSSIDDIFRGDSVSSADIRSAIETHFVFDAVTCIGVPLLHCVRLMCSFLLSGTPGEVLTDRKTRVSVKSLALHCTAAALKLFPEAFCAPVLPDSFTEASNMSVKGNQLIRDIILLEKHEDPQIKGALAAIIGNLLNSAIAESNGHLEVWSQSKCNKYVTGEITLSFLSVGSSYSQIFASFL